FEISSSIHSFLSLSFFTEKGQPCGDLPRGGHDDSCCSHMFREGRNLRSSSSILLFSRCMHALRNGDSLIGRFVGCMSAVDI
ncbi:hypothetical protein CSUI_006839, partial [Cystoisospora suis]